jgi:hypothetical protein
MFEPKHETPRPRPIPLCSPRARCYTLRFVHVPTASCAYCDRAERLVNTWEMLRATAHAYRLAGWLVALLALAGCHHGHQEHELDAGDVDAGSAWLCYCNGTHAITCTRGEPICGATDQSARVAASEGTTCTCIRQGTCFRGADCLDVHAPAKR